jgi:hypothetical protein
MLTVRELDREVDMTHCTKYSRGERRGCSGRTAGQAKMATYRLGGCSGILESRSHVRRSGGAHGVFWDGEYFPETVSSWVADATYSAVRNTLAVRGRRSVTGSKPTSLW